MRPALPNRALVAFVATMVVSACGSASPSTSLPAPTTSAVPATPAPLATSAPSATPSPSFATKVDGQIVFEDAGQDFQYTQIWIENADGSNVRQVVSDGMTDNSASLSPDGTKIVFYAVSGDDFGRILIVNVDGTDLHELDTGSRAEGCDPGPEGEAWSPAGTRIAFTRTCFAQDGSYVGQALWTIGADGSAAREVTHNIPGKPCKVPFDDNCPHLEDHRAGWSPDGKRLVFDRIDTSVSPERAAIFTIWGDGNGLRQVTPWSLDGNDPDWSPDGKLIAFNASAEPSPTQNIYTIHPDGTGLKQLTNFDEDGQATYHPSWSPDGTQLLFSHAPSTDGWADFFIMDRDGGNQHVIAKTALRENHGSWGVSPTP